MDGLINSILRPGDSVVQVQKLIQTPVVWIGSGGMIRVGDYLDWSVEGDKGKKMVWVHLLFQLLCGVLIISSLTLTCKNDSFNCWICIIVACREDVQELWILVAFWQEVLRIFIVAWSVALESQNMVCVSVVLTCWCGYVWALVYRQPGLHCFCYNFLHYLFTLNAM